MAHRIVVKPKIVREQIREHLRLELAIEDILMTHRFGVKPKIHSRPKSKERVSVTSCLNFATEMLNKTS